jgi:hypothetical protein
VKWHATIP